MSRISELQVEHNHWLRRNFPDQTVHQPLLGLVEEVGELAHARLKYEQAIRGMGHLETYKQAEEDAIGDIFIYLMSYCNTQMIHLETVIEGTWDRVKKRDWVSDPDGVSAQ